MARIKVTDGKSAVVGERPTAWRYLVLGLLDGQQKTGRRDLRRIKPDRAALIHVSSTLRRDYPWQVASPQSLRPFHLAARTMP